jgi:hypothetical protein
LTSPAADHKKDASPVDASFLLTIYYVPHYQVEFSQPRSSMALTTREIATM